MKPKNVSEIYLTFMLLNKHVVRPSHKTQKVQRYVIKKYRKLSFLLGKKLFYD